MQSLIALASLAGVFLGHYSIAATPWGSLAISGGVALASMLRLGWQFGIGAAIGVLLGLFMVGTPIAGVFWFGASLFSGLVAATAALRKLPFNTRLYRARDVAWLVTTVILLASALPAVLIGAVAALPTAGVSFGLGSNSPLGWGVLSLGLMATSFTALLADRHWRQAFMPPRQVISLLLVFAVLVAGGLPWVFVLRGAAEVALLLAVAAPLLLALMTLRAGANVASALLLAIALAGCWLMSTMAVNAATPGSLPPYTPELGIGLATMVTLALAFVMIVHAARMESAWREQRWEWALDGSRLGVADWQLRRPESFASAAWRALTAIDSGPWTPDLWLRQVHADDRQALEQAIAQVAAGEAGRVQLEMRMPAAAGMRWMEATLLVIERGNDDRPSRLLATLSDVEERHDALERQRLSGSLFQHLHEGLLITDGELRVLDANPAYTHILGVPRAELLGSVPSLLRQSPADPLARQQRAAMWAGLRAAGSWRGELLERRRNGELCTLQATISTVPGTDLDLRHHVLVISDISEQRAQRERLERQAHFDELTRLPNRARLSQLMIDAMAAADRDGYLLVVCYLDLDRFKPVNDRLGHAAGDRLLVELAGRLRSALRGREHWVDSAARLGGDEFVLLLRAGTLEEARLAVERVLRVVSQPYEVDPSAEPVVVTASMGATVYPIDRSDADALLRHADHAMYGAKQSGRNGYLFFDPETRRRTEERVMIIGRVQEALDHAEFVLYYQPKVDMRSGRVLGFEALLRWDHPQQGIIAPMQFLPQIENTGLSARIGDWVFSQALEHLAHWRRQGLDISVSVNVSARHLQEPDFAQRLSELLARHPEPLAPYVELEILETTAHNDIDATSALLSRCRLLGVHFALDDFGTAYSNLRTLKQLPVDVLKIDRSFVHNMLDDPQDRGLVEGVISLARTFGCTVVAEGVETPAQARALLDMGCDIGQGTGLAAPMPAGLVAAWVRDYRGIFALAQAPAQASRAIGATD